MGRRQIKQRRIDALKARVALKLLKPEHLEGFRLMYAKCRTELDFSQVDDVVRQFCLGVQGRSDRYALLMRDDPLGLET